MHFLMATPLKRSKTSRSLAAKKTSLSGASFWLLCSLLLAHLVDYHEHSDEDLDPIVPGHSIHDAVMDIRKMAEVTESTLGK